MKSPFKTQQKWDGDEIPRFDPWHAGRQTHQALSCDTKLEWSVMSSEPPPLRSFNYMEFSILSQVFFFYGLNSLCRDSRGMGVKLSSFRRTVVDQAMYQRVIFLANSQCSGHLAGERGGIET